MVQAENDDGENAQINAGIAKGCELTPEQVETANLKVKFYRFKGGVTGLDLDSSLRALLQKEKPDLLILDPFAAFFDGELGPKDVSQFYRQFLRPMMEDFSIGCLVVHHFGKPLGVGGGKQVQFTNEHAYDGAGAAEQANFCRAIVSIRATKKPGVFQLHYGKRGGRLPRRPEFIVQSDDPTTPFWRELPLGECPAGPADPVSLTAKLLERVPPGERIRKSEARLLYKDMGCQKRLWESVLEQVLVAGYFIDEDQKVGKTRVRWMVRTSAANMNR